MIDWNIPLTLYHGSYCAVPNPCLAKCNPFKDFGQGFYLTPSKTQAEHFVVSAVKKAIRLNTIENTTNFGIVNIYRYKLAAGLKIKEFQTANEEWLHCVVAHRKNAIFPQAKKELEQYDLIAGKIANDQTNATLIAYLSGFYGEVGTKEADEDCIRRLLPERLESQICLRTLSALSALNYLGEEKIWIRNL